MSRKSRTPPRKQRSPKGSPSPRKQDRDRDRVRSRSPKRSRSRSPRKTDRDKDRERERERERPARKERSPTPRPTKIHVGRLTRNVTKEHVQEIFSDYGTIKNIQFEYERHQQHLGKGFAYIEFSTPDEAEDAMKHMDGGQIDGQEITAAPVLNISRPPRPLMMRRTPPLGPRRRPRGWSPRGRSPYRRRSPPRPRRQSPPRRRRYERSSSSSSR